MNEESNMPGPTKPIKEHEWLQNLVGDWLFESEMMMPNGENVKGKGKETVQSLKGLWAFGEMESTMPNGELMKGYTAIGYDVTFKEYRGCWFGDVSSHLWKYIGKLSEDRKKLTLECEGPDMTSDEEGATSMYRDIHEIIDENTRTLTSYGQDKSSGEWKQFMKATYKRK